jgi:hypothetical protein
MATLQEVYLLLRLAPLQLTAEQCEAVLGVLEQGAQAAQPDTARELWALRQRLLAGEPATAADNKLLREAANELRRTARPQEQEAALEGSARIAEILTVEQLGIMLGAQNRGAIIRAAADTRAARVVLNAVAQAMKVEDATQRTEKLRAVLETVRAVGGELIDEATATNLEGLLSRVEQMGLPEFSAKDEELLAEVEVLLPGAIDPGALSVALERERALGLVQSLFFHPLAAGLVRERRARFLHSREGPPGWLQE